MINSESPKDTKNYNLTFQLLFYIILCSSIFTLIGTIIQLHDDYSKDIKEINNHLTYISEAYSTPLAASLWDVNHDQIRRTLEGVMKLPGVAFLEISAVKGSSQNIVTVLGKKPQNSTIIRKIPLSYGQGKIPVGSLTVVASNQKVIQRLKERIFIILITQALKTFVVSLCIFFIFQYLIMRHLISITHYFRNFIPDRPETPLVINRKPSQKNGIDLFELLIQSINQMRLKLLESLEQRSTYEKELNQLKNQLKSIIDNMPALLIGLDHRGQVNQWNREAENETKILEKDALGKDLTTVIPLMSDHIEILKQAKSLREPVKKTEVIQHDGQDIIYWDIMVYPLLCQEPSYLVIRLENVTERVKLSQILIQNEKMISVGKLSSGLAHEINNPLGGMIQNAQVISNRINSNLPANDKIAKELGTSMEVIRAFFEKRKIMVHLDMINEAGRRAASVVNNMLSFIKNSNMPRSDFSITKLLDNTIELLVNDYDIKKHTDFTKIKIVKSYSPQLPPVSCDANRIQQVFLNILKNGAQAMEGCDNPTFFLNVLKTDNNICIEIIDNGPGISHDIQQKIFEPFFTTKPVDKGTGLGLYVSYMIITQNHNGSLKVKSADKGTCFTIQLPIRREHTH